VLAAVFFVTSLVLTYYSGHRVQSAGVMQSQQKLQQVVPPVLPASAIAPVAPAGSVVPGNSQSKAGEIPK
jgi:preprotein translocase subunit SecG